MWEYCTVSSCNPVVIYRKPAGPQHCFHSSKIHHTNDTIYLVLHSLIEVDQSLKNYDIRLDNCCAPTAISMFN